MNTSGEQLSHGISNRNRRKVNLLNIPAATGPDARLTRGMDGCVLSIHVGGETPHLKKTQKKHSSRKPAFQASIIDAWLSERCSWGEAALKGRTLAGDLFADFLAWGQGRNLAAVTQTAFGRHLCARGIRRSKTGAGGRVVRWPIQLKAASLASLAGPALDPHERDKARRLAAMPSAAVFAAFQVGAE